VIEEGEELEDPRGSVTSALVNGSIKGDELEGMENASLEDWTERISDIGENAGYSLQVELEESSFDSAEGFEAVSSYRVFARLKDPTTLAAFNSTQNATATVSFEGLEDTLLLLRSQGRYAVQYERCGFDDPAVQVESGNIHSSGTGYGESVVNPGSLSGISDKSEKVLAVDDIDTYDQGEVNNFAGAVSADDNDTSGYTTEYVFDTGDIGDIDENTSLILADGDVWRSSFQKMFTENCYIEVDSAPGIFDRLGGDPEGDEGIVTLVDVRDLPSELQEIDSVVGYVYFTEVGRGELNEIKGVSDEYSWFRIDDHHVNEWNLGPLASG